MGEKMNDKNVVNVDEIEAVTVALDFVEGALLAWDVEAVAVSSKDIAGLQFLIAKANDSLKESIGNLD